MRNILDDEIRRFGRILHYAGVLATVVGMAASYSLWHVPLLAETDRTAERIQELTLSVQNARAIREQYEKVSARLATAKAQIATVKQRVPQEAEPGQFVDEVSRIAIEESLDIKDYANATPIVHEGYTQMEVTLTGRGNYAAVCTFLDRLASMKRLSKLQNLTLTASGSATEYPLTATLIIYFGLRGTDENEAQEVKRG